MGHSFEPDRSLGAEDLKAESSARSGDRSKIAGHPLFHPEEYGGGVIAIDFNNATEALAKDMIDRTAEIDHAVDGVDSHRSQPSAGSLLTVSAPLTGFQQQRVGERHRRLDVQNDPKASGPDSIAKLRHLRMETAVVPQTQRHAGTFCGLDGRFRVRFRQREGLLTK